MGFAFHLFRRPCLSCWRFTPRQQKWEHGREEEEEKMSPFPILCRSGSVSWLHTKLSLSSFSPFCVCVSFVWCWLWQTAHQGLEILHKNKTHTHTRSIHPSMRWKIFISSFSFFVFFSWNKNKNKKRGEIHLISLAPPSWVPWSLECLIYLCVWQAVVKEG